VYRTGHYGVSLLVVAPVSGGLLAAGYPDLAVAVGAVVVGLAPLPDYDTRVPFVEHRGPTHTVAFALVVGAVVGAVGWAAGATHPLGRTALGAMGAGAGTLAVLAHLAGDVLTPAGVRPWWPVSGREYTLDLVRAANPVANYLLLTVGVAAAVGVLALVGP
jgi:inner membrane protein